MQIELVGKNEFRHAALLKRRVVSPALNVNKSIGRDLSPSASSESRFRTYASAVTSGNLSLLLLSALLSMSSISASSTFLDIASSVTSR